MQMVNLPGLPMLPPTMLTISFWISGERFCRCLPGPSQIPDQSVVWETRNAGGFSHRGRVVAVERAPAD